MYERKTWDARLMCHWSEILVVEEGHVAIMCPRLNVVNMRGAIEIGTAVMPDATTITAYEDGIPDVTYNRSSPKSNKWKAKALWKRFKE